MNTNLNFIIKIISPKIDIKKFFQNNSPEIKLYWS